MRRLAFLVALALVPSLAAAEGYSLVDEGDFEPAGRRVEFYDRFGWRSYRAEFDFSFDESQLKLGKESKLALTIRKKDGREWFYVCRAKGRQAMTGRINFLFGKGISVTVDCRISDKDFAKAVDLEAKEVGPATLTYQATILDGEVRPGASRGFSLSPDSKAAADINSYAVGEESAGLAVIFRSNTP